mgnify:CR=1 FL=1|tara:strand:+ start:76 stop:633 length:558 start_codon:yes stop_codon:yes gene_type:complete
MNKDWFDNYFKLYSNFYNEEIRTKLYQLKQILVKTNDRNAKTMIFGNGGSAAIASHVAVDLTKNARIKVLSYNDADLITCFSNDYGYEFWVEKSIEFYSHKNDNIILISSSGKSPNMVNAANYAKDKNLNIVTFTGFDRDNPLKQTGDINFWVDSEAYNVVEMIHHIWLLAACDAIIGNAVYPAN